MQAILVLRPTTALPSFLRVLIGAPAYFLLRHAHGNLQAP